MTSKIICMICFIFSMATLWCINAETQNMTLVNVTTPLQEHSGNVSSTKYVSPTTTASSVEGTSDRNASLSKESPTASSIPAFKSLVTEATSTAETSMNGSVGITTFTTRAVTTSLSSVTEPVSRETDDVSNATGSATLPPTQKNSTSENNITVVTSQQQRVPTTQVTDARFSKLKDSEAVLTSIFGTILGIAVLGIIAFSFNKYRKRRSQYSHHPLRENSYESADRYSAPDDTLVISGGLYDAPRVYNPNMTVLEEEDTPHDYVSFSSRPGQFRLEFLPGDKEMDPVFNGSTFETSHSLRKNV
ncbi:hypothetical protein FKM82_025547 [Ascaphus truei]